MKNFFRLLSLALILIIVALVSAFTTIRLAIHAHEITVPSFVGKTPHEAGSLAAANGLAFQVERRFYSTQIAPGHIVSQVPEPGTVVRRGWQVRAAESLGPQRVSILNVIGESGRAAQINLRERGFEVGEPAIAHIPDAIPDHVVGQDPPVEAHDVSSPKLSVLLAAPPDPPAFVMADFTGQPLAAAKQTIEQAGLQLGRISVAALPSTGTNAATGAVPSAAPNVSELATIVSQNPVPGAKVLAGTAVDFELSK